MKDITVYNCTDGRTRVYIKESQKVISYPKFLMEQKLGRSLLPNEQVHHIDGNPLNNDIDNLEIKLLGEHQKEHNPPKYYDKIVICEWCGKEFTWTAKQQSQFYRNRKYRGKVLNSDTKPFCSKQCVGEYGRFVQQLG